MGRESRSCVCSGDKGVGTRAFAAAAPVKTSDGPNYQAVESTFVESVSGDEVKPTPNPSPILGHRRL